MRVMPDLTLDLRYLKYAIHVAEAGSFRRAADRLSISQSTVSRRVQMGRVPDGGVAPEGHHDAGLAGLVRRPRLAG